jgi:hypothetical protein
MTIQPNTAAFFGSCAAGTPLAPPHVQVRIDGQLEPRIRLDYVESEMGAAPKAWFSVGFGRNPTTGDDVRLEDVAASVRPGRAVHATLLRGGVFPGTDSEDLVVFEGRIGRLEMGLNADGESLRFEAEDAANELLRRRVGGRRAWTAEGAADRVEGLALVFNPDGRPNASDQPYDPGTGDSYKVFASDGTEASAWTLDEAIAYVLGEHGAADDVDVPSPSEIRDAACALVIRDVSLEGRTLAEALGALLELVGGRIVVTAKAQVTGVSRRLEIWYPDRAPVAWFAHQPPGERYDPAATNLVALSARMRFDSAPRRYVARGDRKVYESTFDLVAGWDDALATYDPDDFSPSANPDFDAVRDVFRKWVLNEAGEYSESPYERGPAPDLSALFEGSPYVRRHRCLLPCLSRDALGRSHGVYAEVSLDGGATWERLSLGVRVLRGECGLYLTDDPLPPGYLAAAMRGQVCVRVTATVESDAVLVAEYAGEEMTDLPGRTRHLNVPAGYRYRRVAATSRFYGQAGSDEVDDSARLEDLVRAAYEADRRTPTPTRVEIPYLAMGHHVGQRILGIRGRRLDLAREHGACAAAPVARRLRLTFAPVPQTELELE